MNDIAVRVILHYLEQETPAPKLCWPACQFEKASFSRWAAGELLEQIADHPLTPAEDTVEEFAFAMALYAAQSKGRSSERIFSIAEQTAREILRTIEEMSS